jgi:hypothetical protein
MGESLNSLVDHRATFMRWWKESMAEVNARRELAGANSDEEKDEAMHDLRSAGIAKLQLLNAIRAACCSMASAFSTSRKAPGGPWQRHRRGCESP